MKRTFLFSSDTFQGFRVDVDVLAAGSLDNIVADCVSVLVSAFRALGLARLADQAKAAQFHVHNCTYDDVLQSTLHDKFFVCEHSAVGAPPPAVEAPPPAEKPPSGVVAAFTVKWASDAPHETMFICTLSTADAFRCGNRIRNTKVSGPGGASGIVSVDRYFHLERAIAPKYPTFLDRHSNAALAQLSVPEFVTAFLRGDHGD